MAFELGSIVARIKSDTSDFKRGIGDAKREADGLGGRLGKMSGVAKAAFAAAAAAAVAFGAVAIKKAVDAASTFETKMSNISTLISGDSTKAVATLSDEILKMTRRVPKSADELGAAAYDILSAGVTDTSDQLKVLEASARLATAGLGDTQGATDLMTSSINAFGLDAGNAGGIADVLFKTVKNGKTTVDQLRQGFGGVAPAAAAAGVKLEELMAATSALTTTGLPASEAYTQLKASFGELTKPSGDLKAALEAVGITNAKSAIETDGLDSVIQKLFNHVGKDTVKLKNLFGSVEAGNAIISLASGVNGAYTTTLADMTGGANALDEAFIKQTQTYENAKAKLSNLINEGFIRLGSVVLPILVSALQYLADNIPVWIGAIMALPNAIKDGFDKAAEAVGWAKDKIVEYKNIAIGVGSVLAAIFLPYLIMIGVQALITGGQMVAGAVMASGAWVASAIRTAGAWLATFITMRVGAAATAIASVVQAAAAGWAWVGAGVRAAAGWAVQFGLMVGRGAAAAGAMALSAASTALGWVMAAARAGTAWLVQFGLMIARAIMAGAAMLAPIVIAGIGMIAQAVAVGIAWIVAMLPVIAIIAAVAAAAYLVIRNWETIRGFVAGLASSIISWFNNAKAGVISAAQSAGAGLKGAFNSAVNAVSGIINRIVGFVRGMVGAVGGAVAGVKNALTAPFRSAVDEISGLMEKAKGALSKLNPFKRSSPSLVDWVKRGTKVIANEYDDLNNSIASGTKAARIQTIGTARSVTNIRPSEVGTGASGSGGGSRSVTVNVTGVLADSAESKRRFADELLRVINDDRSAKGIRTVG